MGFESSTLKRLTKKRGVDTSGNNHHATLFSGRGLEVDGISDTLQIDWGTNDGGSIVNQPVFTNWTQTMWLWIDPDWTTGAPSNITGGGSGGGSLQYGLTVYTVSGAAPGNAYQAAELANYVASGDGTSSSGWIRSLPIAKGVWVRVVNTHEILSNGKSHHKLYIDNASAGGHFPYTSGNTAATNGRDTGKLNYIGSYDGSSRYGMFRIADFQLWDTVWTDSDVEYDYLHPEKLAIHRSGTSLTYENLMVWYPFTDGNRGNQLSRVHDASGVSVSSTSYAVDLSMDTASGWTVPSGWSQDTTNETVSCDGTANITIQSPSDRYIIGDYQLSYDITNYSSGQVLVRSSSGSDTERGEAGAYNDYDSANGSYTKYLRLQGGNWVAYSKPGDGFVGTIGNVKLRKINNKYNGIGTFLGEEQIIDPKNQTFGSSPDWQDSGTTANQFSQDSGEYDEAAISGATEGTYFTDNYLKLVATADSDGSEIRSCHLDGQYFGEENAAAGVKQMRLGAQYRCSYSIEITAISAGTLSVGFGTAAQVIDTDSDKTYTSTKTAATDSFDFTYKGATDHAQLMIQAAGNSAFTAYFDNFSIKEIGYAQAWTNADEQDDGPQSALMGFNDLMWFNGYNTFVSVSDANDFSFTDGSNTDSAFSVSFWIQYVEADKAIAMIQKGTVADGDEEWFIARGADEKIYFRLWDQSESNCYIGCASSITYDGPWHGRWMHICATYSGSETSAGCILYVNGCLAGSAASENDPDDYAGMENLGGTLDFGKYQNDTFLNGSMTEISLWGVALSPAEVEEIYNNGKALDALKHSKYLARAADLRGYWRNNVQKRVTWLDLSSSPTNGTLSGATENILIPWDGILTSDTTRDSQGFLMNRPKRGNSLNLIPGFEEVTGAATNEIYAAPYAQIEPHAGAFSFGDGSTDDSPFSVSAWVYCVEAGNFTIISKAADVSTGNEWFIRINSSDKPLFALYDNGTSPALTLTADAAISENTWHNITFTYSGNEEHGGMLYYLNGVLAASTGAEGGTYGAMHAKDDVTVQIGMMRRTTQAYQTFANGYIDDVLVYNRVLTAAEVLRNYNATKGSHS